MFYGCTSLREVDLTGFDTKRVESLDALFEGCASLRTLDLSYLDTSFVETTRCICKDCSSLESADLSFPLPRFDRSRWTRNPAEEMFVGCTSLRKWRVSASWPVTYYGSLPEPTNKGGVWWSEHDQAWMTNDEISRRNRVADTFTNEAPKGKRWRLV